MKCEIYENGRIEIKASEAFFASEGYCLFHVKACGICGSDAPRVFSGASYYYPIVLGHEFSGYVAESTKSELVGKRACVFPILPCGECEFCKKQAWASCIRYDYYGSRRDGGMQSELLIKEDNLVFLPDSVSFEAGAMVEPSAVCLHAVKRAGVSDGSRVLIYGAGTIGMLCAMWARILGAEGVYLKDPDPTRCSFAEKIGFSVYGGESVDVIIEASGAQAALSDAIENCQPLGRVALVGHGKADVTLKHETFVKVLRKQLTLVGSWNSDFNAAADDWEESVRAIAEGRLRVEELITHRFKLEEADRAFGVIRDRKENYNKIMVVMK